MGGYNTGSLPTLSINFQFLKMSVKQQLYSKILPWLLESVMKQGMSFVLIGVMAYFFYQQDIKNQIKNEEKIQVMDSKVEKLQKDIVEYHRTDRMELLRVVQANTTALQNLKCK